MNFDNSFPFDWNKVAYLKIHGRFNPFRLNWKTFGGKWSHFYTRWVRLISHSVRILIPIQRFIIFFTYSDCLKESERARDRERERLKISCSHVPPHSISVLSSFLFLSNISFSLFFSHFLVVCILQKNREQEKRVRERERYVSAYWSYFPLCLATPVDPLKFKSNAKFTGYFSSFFLLFIFFFHYFFLYVFIFSFSFLFFIIITIISWVHSPLFFLL